MTKKYSTKRALIASILALCMCFTMLIGTTFAWFTDSVTSSGNVIQTGTLEVKMYYADGKLAVPADDSADWVNADGKAIYTADQLWEPGYTDAKHIKISNEGSLALQYQLAIIPTGEVSKLAEVIDVYYIEDATQIATRENLANYSPIGTLDDLINNGIKRGNLSAYTDYTATLVLKMQENAGNEYQDLSIGDDFTIQLLATQYTEESDSFDENYDKDSSAFVSTAEELKTAIANVKNGGTVYVNNGTYNIDSQLTVAGKSLNIVGLGENVVIHMTNTRQNYNKIFYIYGSATEGKDVTVNISNVTLTAAVATKSDIWIRTDTQSGSKVKGNVTVNLDNVTCASVICDNNYVDGDTINLKVTNSSVKKVTLDASPFNGNGLNTYTNLTYVASRIDSINIQSGVNDLTHIKINGVNPIAHGEQQPLTYVDTAEELQAALDNAVDGDIIVLGSDITGDVTATQKADVKITVDGNGKTFAGVLLVDGKSETFTTAGLTIKNVNFKADTISADACIQLGNGTNATRYTCNVTVDNCTFDVPGAVGVKSYTGGDKNLAITDCTATERAHSLVQAKGIDGVLVENCKVYSKNGLNFNNSTNVTVDNCTVDVKGYAVRFGESSGGSGDAEIYLIEKCTLKSACDDGDAVIMLRGTADNSTLTINNTTLEGTNNIKDTASNALIIIDGKYWVSSADELKAVVAMGETDIYLVDGVYENIQGCAGKTLTLSGSKNAILKLKNEGEDGCDYDFGNSSGVGNITFNGLTIDTTANTGNYKGYAYMKGTFNDCNFVGAYSLNNANDFVFNRCTFDLKNGYFWTWGAKSVTFDGCTFNGNSKTILAHGSASTVININNCTFAATEKGYTGAGDNTAVVEMDPIGSNAYTVNFTGTNTKTDSYAGWTRVKDGSTGHTVTGLN